MQTENEEELRPPESCHAIQLLFKSLEASEKCKLEQLDKNKENESLRRTDHHALWDITHGNETLRKENHLFLVEINCKEAG